MECTRTANAGVLLKLDGASILLDGVCQPSGPYLGTPEHLRQSLYDCPPDLIAFTHGHKDHFDLTFSREITAKTLRPISGPECLVKGALETGPVQLGPVCVTPIPTRHIGKAGQGTPHVSFLIQGSKRILFTGDAAPTVFSDLPPVDVVIGPYAYATTTPAWRRTAALCETLVLLHLPDPAQDEAGLWKLVEETTRLPGPQLRIPSIGETIQL